jgi:hypothetical protein
MPLFIFKLYVSQESDTQLAFRNFSRGGNYYWEKKHIREDLILPDLLSENLSHVFDDILQWKWPFCERNKNCAARKNTVKVKQAQGKWQYFKCGGNHLGKRRQSTKFRTFYWKSRGETNSILPNKRVMNNRTLFRDSFFEMLCKETNLYYFENQGKYDNSSKVLKWVDVSVVRATRKRRSETRYICKFCIAPLHKKECFERYHSLKHYLEPWCFLKIVSNKSN